MRPRREYSVAVVIGLLAMGLAMFGAGAALFLAPPPGYAPPPTPTPTAIVTPTARPSASTPQISETPAPSESSSPSEEPTAEPTIEPTSEPTTEPTATPTPGDVFAARRAALPDCPDRDDCGIHTAKSGDWLSRLANYYGVSLDEITRLNPEIEDPNRIRVGQKIRIPR